MMDSDVTGDWVGEGQLESREAVANDAPPPAGCLVPLPITWNGPTQPWCDLISFAISPHNVDTAILSFTNTATKRQASSNILNV